MLNKYKRLMQCTHSHSDAHEKQKQDVTRVLSNRGPVPTQSNSWTGHSVQILAALVFFTIATSACSSPTVELVASDDDLVCRVTVSHTLYEDGAPDHHHSESTFECLPIDGSNASSAIGYPINLPASIAEEEEETLLNGMLHIRIPNGYIDYADPGDGSVSQKRVFIPNPEAVTVFEPPSTRSRIGSNWDYNPKVGRQVAIIWIKTADSTPDYSADYIFEVNFGIKPGKKDPNYEPIRGGAADQYRACSYGQLNFVPYDNAIGDDNPTPIEVHLPGPIAEYPGGKGRGPKEAAIKHMKNVMGYPNEFFDGQNVSLMFIVPPGSGAFIANATSRGHVSTYSNKWGADMGTVIHEIGHNLGLGHAGMNENPYGDPTCNMGGASPPPKPTTPRKCFNGGNSLALDLYQEDGARLSFDPADTTGVFRLASFVDYDTAARRQRRIPVVAKIEIPEIIGEDGKVLQQDLYLQYNRSKGINDGVGKKDQLSVVRRYPGGTWWVAGLSAEEHHNNVEQKLVVEGINPAPVIEVCGPMETTADGKLEYLLVGVDYDGTACDNGVSILDPEQEPPTVTIVPSAKSVPRGARVRLTVKVESGAAIENIKMYRYNNKRNVWTKFGNPKYKEPYRWSRRLRRAGEYEFEAVVTLTDGTQVTARTVITATKN